MSDVGSRALMGDLLDPVPDPLPLDHHPERVFIGGKAIAMRLTIQRCTVSTLFQFDDLQDQLVDRTNEL